MSIVCIRNNNVAISTDSPLRVVAAAIEECEKKRRIETRTIDGGPDRSEPFSQKQFESIQTFTERYC